MLPTPDTSHVDYDHIYEPAEDSFLFLDTLSSATEIEFLKTRFPSSSSTSSSTPCPLVLEIGPGSGVVIAFVHAHARTIFGRPDVLTAAVDVNGYACRAARETVRRAARENAGTAAMMGGGGGVAVVAETAEGNDGVGKEGRKRRAGEGERGEGEGLALTAQADLTSPLRPGSVDVLLFNPPYVPTPEMPRLEEEQLRRGHEKSTQKDEEEGAGGGAGKRDFDHDSYLLSLSYAGGRDGMETTDRLVADLPRVLSERGCAYVLLCQQNRPQEFKDAVRRWPGGTSEGEEEKKVWSWRAETVGSSGKTAGWEKLQIVRIWREWSEEGEER